MEREIGRLDGHYILCGMGPVGRSVARELARKPVPFVVLENAETKRQRFATENCLVIAGDATEEATLRQAQIDRARGLIAATTGKTIESSRIRPERGVIVPAIKRREAMHFNPAPDERIEPDDCLMAMGEPAELRQLELTATSKS